MRGGGRDPATLQVTVGITIDEASSGPRSLPLEVGAIADALRAWEAEGADHVQLGVGPSTEDSFGVVLEAIDRYRA